MRQSLAEAAVRGTSHKTLTDEKRSLLDGGDIEGLLQLNRAQFGGFFMGPEDDYDDDGNDDDDNDDGTDDDDDDDDTDDKGKKSKVDPKDVRIQELSAEAKKKRIRIREQAAEIKRLEAEVAAKAKIKAKSKDKDDDDDDGADDGPSEELTEAQTELEKSQRNNEDLLIRLEFTTNTAFKWKNPKAALRLLDLSDVEVTDDGEVEGLDEAIKALAKSDPYLLEDSKDDDDDDEDDETKRRKRSTGQKTGTRKKGNPNREKLVNKYPALRR